MAVSGYISGRSFKLHKSCQSDVYTNNILFWNTIHACCFAIYRDITPGSELSDHPSYIYHFESFENIVIVAKQGVKQISAPKRWLLTQVHEMSKYHGQY